MFESCSDVATQSGYRGNGRVVAPAQIRPMAVRRAIEYMHSNLAHSVHLEDIAGVANMSVFHFCRVFRAATGMTPHRFLIEARVEKVKMLLLQGGQNLAAIADDAGFSDQSHMSKVFRKWVGITPTKFRANQVLPVEPCVPFKGKAVFENASTNKMEY
jgi:AraC-like DNA-binding protein